MMRSWPARLGSINKEDDERKKKKRKEKHAADEEDDSMWVEAPAPEAVQHLAAPKTLQAPLHESAADPTPTSTSGTPTPEEHANQLHSTHKPRKRAIDFM